MMHHYYLYLNRKLKDAHLIHLCNEAQRTGQTTAIFTRSLSETRRVSRLLHSLKMGIVSLQSNLSRSARAAALDKLRRKECHAIVTTDVAATLDPIRVPVVDRIINFSLTWKMTAGTYMQRISNVDGAGSSWHGAITFVTQYDVDIYLRLERALGVPLTEYAIDMDTVMSCRGQVEEAILEDSSLEDKD